MMTRASKSTRTRRTSASSSRRLRSSLVAPIALALPLLGIATAVAQTVQNDPPSAPGRLLIAPRAGLPAAEFEKILKPHGGKSARRIPGTNVHVVELPPNVSEKAVARMLAGHAHLKFVELDVKVQSQMMTDDPYFGSEWHLYQIQAPTAWDLSTGSGVTIAILDTGVDATHPDLASRLVPGWNFYDNNANTSDVHGHGTKVAGTAAAASNNAVGVSSVAGNAILMPIRVADATAYAYFSTMAQGITWAADHGARVANLSYDGAGGSSTVQSAAQYMKNKGGLVVTAAGNSGAQQTYAANDSILVVSATDGNDQLASWSSYGSFVDIAAPGVSILTTTVGGGYGSVSGTSFSSPITAGVVALIMAANPTLSAGQVQNVLLSTAVDIGPAGSDIYYGVGRVNAAAAVQAAVATVARDTSAPTVSVTSPAAGTVVKGLVPIDVSATDNVSVSRVELAVNGTTYATDTSGPYGFSWDSTSVPDGNVTLTAYAYDGSGNYASRSVSVTVQNTADTLGPKVAISNPIANAKVTGNVNIQANASDNTRVTSVKLYIDGKLMTTSSSSSVSYKWNTKPVSSGQHTLQVDATDASGNVGTQQITVIK
jgi:subtilisin family serine protease